MYQDLLIKSNKKLIINNTDCNIMINIEEHMNNLRMNKLELLEKCKELGITKYKSKNKSQLTELINSKTKLQTNIIKESKIILENEEIPLLSKQYVSVSIESESTSKSLNVLDLFCGSKVLTYSGYKNIEDVVLEDRLLTHTGKFQTIINLQKKILSGDLYELDIKYYPEIIKYNKSNFQINFTQL